MAVVAALLMNLAVSIAKFIAAFFSGSSAMLAEAYHSVSDTFNQVFLLVGIKASRRKPDKVHPFGYGQEQFFWSFIVAMAIFGIAGVLSFREGWHKLTHPHPLENLVWSYIVLFAAIGFEAVALRVAYKEFKKAMNKEGITSKWEGIKRSKDPVILTVLFEDSLAITSLLVALVGITLAAITHNPFFDGIASMIIGVLLMVFASILAMETKKLLIGEGVTPGTRKKLQDAMASVEGVESIITLKTMHMGPKKVIVAAEVHLKDGLVTDQIEKVVDEVEKECKKVVPEAECYIEVEDLPKKETKKKTVKDIKKDQ